MKKHIHASNSAPSLV